MNRREDAMYGRLAHFYDTIHAAKDYAAESAQLHAVIQQSCPGAASLLDVACGTGEHLARLQAYYRVAGVDLSQDMLAVARKRNPDVPLHQGDLVDFAVGQRFDVVVCLGSAIGYTKTVEKLNQAVANMARHVRPGGVLAIYSWILPEAWRPGTIHADFVDEPNLKIARMNVSETLDRVSVMDFHFLVGTPEGVEHFVDRHELGLFAHEEYVAACLQAGLSMVQAPQWSEDRRLYVGVLGE